MDEDRPVNLQEMIDKSREESLGKKKKWEGTVLDFLKMVKDGPPEHLLRTVLGCSSL